MITQLEVKNPMAHSYSRLQVFSGCPLSYKLQYLDKVSSESNDAMEIGSAAHEFFENFVRGNKFHDSTESNTFDSYVNALSAECFQKEARDQSNFKDYLEICRTFAKTYKPDPAYPRSIPEKQVAFDRNWKRCDWFSRDVMFRAKIDRTDEPVVDESSPNGSDHVIKKIRICDYKTGFAGAMDSFQLDVYALMAKLIYPHLEQVEVEFYYVKSGFRQVKLLRVEDLDITKIQLEALMERIEGEKKWKAKPGAKCLNCSVAIHCSEKPGDLRAISAPEDAATLGQEIAVLEAQAKAKKKVLNVYCQKQGPVEAGGLVYAHYPIESMVVEMAPLLSLCVQYNIDPSDILNPDSKALKKAIRENLGFGEAISPYVGVDVSTRFYAKKSQGDDD